MSCLAQKMVIQARSLSPPPRFSSATKCISWIKGVKDVILGQKMVTQISVSLSLSLSLSLCGHGKSFKGGRSTGKYGGFSSLLLGRKGFDGITLRTQASPSPSSTQGRLEMVFSELDTSKASLNKMNAGSKRLDEILCSQKAKTNMHGIGYTDGASTSKAKGNNCFVQTSVVTNSTVHVTNTAAKKKNVSRLERIPTYYHYGIKGHIRPHCNKLQKSPNHKQWKKQKEESPMKTVRELLISDCSTRGKKGELYVYVERDPNKSRQKRSVSEEFFWRTTNSSMITDKGTVVGQKTSLVFHTRRGQKSTKPEWMMQEYCLIAAASPEGSSSLTKDMKMKKVGKFVLCKVYKKKTTEVETEEVSFDSIEDELVDEDRNDRIPSWSYIHKHADDENILRLLQG